MVRPEYVTDEHLEYLDELRDSGETNMWGAGSYLQREFYIGYNLASQILTYWKESFGQDNR